MVNKKNWLGILVIVLILGITIAGCEPPLDESPTEEAEINWNGHRYVLYMGEHFFRSWADARDYCKSKGGHLVTISSESENEAVYNLVKNGEKGVYWIGGYLSNNSWAWVNGEEFNYTNWAPGEPNDMGGKETCIQMYRLYNYEGNDVHGKWNDIGSLGLKDVNLYKLQNTGFICEWDNGDNNNNSNNTVPFPIKDAVLTINSKKNEYSNYKSESKGNQGTISFADLNSKFGSRLTVPKKDERYTLTFSFFSDMDIAAMTSGASISIGLVDTSTDANGPASYWFVRGEWDDGSVGSDYKWADITAVKKNTLISFTDTVTVTAPSTVSGAKAGASLGDYNLVFGMEVQPWDKEAKLYFKSFEFKKN